MNELRYLLDSNICIYLMQAQPEAVIQRFAACQQGEIAMSTMTWAELCCGMDVYKCRDELLVLQSRIILLDFDQQAAELFGRLHQQFPQRKNSFDRMIAAQAIAYNLILVTNNSADFALYQDAGLQLENWVTG